MTGLVDAFKLFDYNKKYSKIVSYPMEDFIKTIDSRIDGSIIVPKELLAIILSIDKKMALIDKTKNFSDKEKLSLFKKKIEAEMDYNLIIIIFKYVQNAIIDISKAKKYLKLVENMHAKYHDFFNCSFVFDRLVPELKMLSEFPSIEKTNEESLLLREFFNGLPAYMKDSFNNQNWNKFTYLYNKDEFEKIKIMLDRPIELFSEERYVLEKIYYDFGDLFSHYHIYPSVYSKLEKLRSQQEFLVNYMQESLNGLKIILELKRDLNNKVKLYMNDDILKFFGEDFAAHGTWLNNMELLISQGMKTGGQGGANFLINDASMGYDAILITKIKYLIRESYKLDALIKIYNYRNNIESNAIFLKKRALVMQPENSSSNVASFINSISEKKGLLLQIEKDEKHMLHVPWVVLTSNERVANNVLLKKLGIDIVYSKSSEFDNVSGFNDSDKLHNLFNLLITTSWGKARLSKTLR